LSYRYKYRLLDAPRTVKISVMKEAVTTLKEIARTPEIHQATICRLSKRSARRLNCDSAKQSG
jgi:DNA-directed RNA polymerase specialized sigma subunit